MGACSSKSKGAFSGDYESREMVLQSIDEVNYNSKVFRFRVGIIKFSFVFKNWLFDNLLIVYQMSNQLDCPLVSIFNLKLTLMAKFVNEVIRQFPMLIKRDILIY